MPHAASASTKTPRIEIPAGSLRFVTKDMLRRILRSLGRQMGIDIQIDGAMRSSSSGGTLSFQVPDGSSSADHPFLCPALTDGSTASVVAGGTVNGIAATNLSLTISNSGTKYVYLIVVKSGGGTLIRTTTEGYVIGLEPIAVSVETGGTLPSTLDTSSIAHRLIATYVSGVRTSQAITSSMEVVARDDGTGTSTPVYIWGQS